MNVPSYASLLILIYSACFAPVSFANDNSTQPSATNSQFEPIPLGAIFTAEMRQTIKREVMSKPGVLLDMANMTDNGYSWTNDVVWVGSSAQRGQGSGGEGVFEQWYIAGFMFQRPRYKGVWLQYAFTLSEATGEIASFKRWYGDATFR